MQNYIRRVRVCGLFDQEQDLVVDFDQSINCIYGMNGTGKTVLINLIVSALRADQSELIASPFSSITILTSPDGKKQPELFLTATKYHGAISYTFYNNHEVNYNTRHIKKKNIISKGQEYFIDLNSKNMHPSIITESSSFKISRSTLNKIINEQLSLTYVPLLRHSYREQYFEQHHFNFNSSSSINDMDKNNVYDPNTKVLAEIQEEFSRRYATAQSVISRKLESLSSIIFKKLLLEDDMSKGPLKESAYIKNLLNKGVVDDSVNVESVISQIRDLNLDIHESMVREHYRKWHNIQKELLNASEKLTEMRRANDSINDEDREKIFTEYSDAYYKLISSRKLYNKLESAIEEIKSVYFKKQIVLSPFNMFKDEINNFLSNNKRFDFTDSGEFIFTNNNRSLSISKLSSGEKHLIAILGRVSFSSMNMSTFIADEPELSLHLEWQRQILPAIRRLSPNTQVIVATHSPAIISKHSNVIDIEGCYKNA